MSYWVFLTSLLGIFLFSSCCLLSMGFLSLKVCTSHCITEMFGLRFGKAEVVKPQGEVKETLSKAALDRTEMFPVENKLLWEALGLFSVTQGSNTNFDISQWHKPKILHFQWWLKWSFSTNLIFIFPIEDTNSLGLQPHEFQDFTGSIKRTCSSLVHSTYFSRSSSLSFSLSSQVLYGYVQVLGIRF